MISMLQQCEKWMKSWNLFSGKSMKWNTLSKPQNLLALRFWASKKNNKNKTQSKRILKMNIEDSGAISRKANQSNIMNQCTWLTGIYMCLKHLSRMTWIGNSHMLRLNKKSRQEYLPLLNGDYSVLSHSLLSVAYHTFKATKQRKS